MSWSLPTRPVLAAAAAISAVSLATSCSLLPGGNDASPVVGGKGSDEKSGESPSGASPSNAAPANAAPTNSAPADGLPADGLPADAAPQTAPDPNGVCAYLDTQWVADTNGQKVTGVGLDSAFNPPACVFYTYNDEPQLTVMVRTLANQDEAIAAVDAAAPIDRTQPAASPTGWNGGRAGNGAVPEKGASLYAVFKDNRTVIVFSNQEQSVKAQTVAEEVIKNQGL